MASGQDFPRDLHNCFAKTPVLTIKCTTQILERGERSDAHLAVVHNNRGNAYYKLRQLERAIADYTAAVKLKPNYANPYNNRGIVHSHNKHFKRAISDFDRAIVRNPKYANAFNNRGYAYQKLNRLEKAGKDYRKALEIIPKHSKAKANLNRLEAMRIPI